MLKHKVSINTVIQMSKNNIMLIINTRTFQTKIQLSDWVILKIIKT